MLKFLNTYGIAAGIAALALILGGMWVASRPLRPAPIDLPQQVVVQPVPTDESFWSPSTWGSTQAASVAAASASEGANQALNRAVAYTDIGRKADAAATSSAIANTFVVLATIAVGGILAIGGTVNGAAKVARMAGQADRREEVRPMPAATAKAAGSATPLTTLPVK